MDNGRELFALANLVLCLTAVGMCLCRLNAMTTNVLYRIRSKYTVALTAALASGLQPWWGEWPGWAALAMSASLVFGLYVSTPHWRYGPPENACSREGSKCEKN